MAIWNLKAVYDGLLPPSVIYSDLILYLDAGNTGSYPGSGITAFDISGLGNNGTLVNGVSYTSSDGGGFVFDGVNDYINLQDDSDWNNLGNSFTVEVVFKQTTASSFQRLVAKQSGSLTTADSCFQLGINSNETFRFSVYTDAGGVDIRDTSVTLNRTYHYVGTYDGANVTRYVDSVSLGSSALTGNVRTSSQLLTLGLSYYAGAIDFEFAGNIYEMRLYKKALSAEEVLHNFSVVRNRYGI